MATIATEPRPAPEIAPADFENEKSSAQEAKGEDSDDGSGVFKQDGVKGVEAVTTAWDKKMLWVTFVL